VQCDPELAAAAGVEVDVFDQLAHDEPDRRTGIVDVPQLQRARDQRRGGPRALAGR
jgi:hypothetical protein